MKVALEVWSSRYDQTETTCLLAESLGFDAFYYGESPHDLNLDCWTTLAALARATNQIRIGPVITNVLPTYRSTALLARQAATVSVISNGRLDLRTGVGASTTVGRRWWEPYGIEYPDYDQRLADLTEALGVLPDLCAGQPIDLPGSNTELPIPLTIAASGDRAMHLASMKADVWETSFCTVSEFADRNARFTELGPPRDIIRSLEIDGFLTRTTDGLDQLLDRVQRERGIDEDLGPVLDRALVGLPSNAAVRLRELAAVGVDQVVVALHDPHDPEALRALADAVNLVSDN